MVPHEQWREAIRAVYDRRARIFFDLVEAEGWPPKELKEAALQALRSLQRSAPSKTAIKLADAFEEFQSLESKIGYRRAFDAIMEKYAIKKPSVLEHVLTKNRPDVNPVLQERGLLSAKFSKFEVTSDPT